MNPRVVVSHPAQQHSYETVVAALRPGYLVRYYTGLYDNRRGLFDPRLRQPFPLNARGRLDRTLSKRHDDRIPDSLVASVPWYHLVEFGVRSWLVPTKFDAVVWARERFDKSVSRRLPQESEVNIVHGFEGSSLETFEAARKLGITTVLDVPGAHEYYREVVANEGGNPRHWDITLDRARRERELADSILVPAPHVAQCLIDYGADPSKISILPYGVDPERFSPDQKIGGSRRQVLFVGQLGSRKGLPYLLRAWETISDDQWTLALAGSVPQDSVNREFQLPSRAKLLGRIPRTQMPAIYASSDIFVLPTLMEGSALVVYEAMASGLPVITTPSAGSFVRDGESGIIIPERDVDALKEALVRLQNDEELRLRLGHQARLDIEGGLTWDHYYDKLEKHYVSLCAE